MKQNHNFLPSLCRLNANQETLFVLKCLAVFDSVAIAMPVFMTDLVTYGFMLGYTHVYNSPYIYVYHAAHAVFRITSPIAKWLVCVLTIQR